MVRSRLVGGMTGVLLLQRCMLRVLSYFIPSLTNTHPTYVVVCSKPWRQTACFQVLVSQISLDGVSTPASTIVQPVFLSLSSHLTGSARYARL
ncbi:hypothetical protein EDB19DRAFT_824728 [Suillus lakei]|nr:hypothetical protein EDB19DRAFT_824728 [Suillus lakei]